MTPETWLDCTDPAPMLAYLGVRASPRKRRLFAIACCRRVLAWMRDERSRQALAFADRFVEEHVGFREEAAVRGSAEDASEAAAYHAAGAADDAAFAAARSAAEVLYPPSADAAMNAAAQAASAAFHAATASDQVAAAARAAERAAQADLVREIFANPFRPAAPAFASVRADPTVVRVAQAIHEEGRFDEVPVLGDALEEAGCAEPDVLAHCRSDKGHVRGCWVVDLCLADG